MRRIKRDFWEKEREKLVATLEQRLTQGRENLALREILSEQTPELIKVVFRRHARRVVRTEKPLNLQSTRQYELHNPKLRAQFRVLRDLLAENLIFHKSELRPILSLGVSLQFDIIVRPRSALENMLYHNAIERERDDVIVVLRGLGDDYPFVTMLVEKVNDYPPGPITKEAMAALCRQVEREIYHQAPVEALVADLQSFLTYCRAVAASGANSGKLLIDNQLILAMLYERNLAELAEEILPEITQRETWRLDEIEELLRSHRTASRGRLPGADGVTLESDREVDLAAFLEEAASQIGDQLSSFDAPEIEESEPAPVVETVVESILPEPPPEAITPSEDAASAPSDDSQQLLPPLPQEAAEQSHTDTGIKIRFEEDEEHLVYRSQLEQQPTGPFPTLAGLIDDRSRRAFVRKLFQKDTDAYLDFVEQLEAAKSWKDAKALMDQEFNRRSVNPYSKEAVRMSDIMFGRYFSKL